MSIQNKVPSEYTCMNIVLVQSDEGKKAPEQFLLQKVDLCLGFKKNKGKFYLHLLRKLSE